MTWAAEEFATAKLGDKRLNDRLIKLAEQLAAKPTASIPGGVWGWGDTAAAYRMLDNERCDWREIIEAHGRCAMQRMAEQPVVLCLHDTTELDFNGQTIQGLGPLSYEAQRGMYLHPTYAVSTDREPLGVLDAWMWAREPKDANGQRGGLCESTRWIESYERLAERAAELPQTRLVQVGDRESDILALIRPLIANERQFETMQELPELSQLSQAEKDELIRLLWSMVQSQGKHIEALQAQVAGLQAKLNKNSRNSSKPPSSDGLNKPAPKSLRVAGQRPTGGQKGHRGTTLIPSMQPERIVVHDVPDRCVACQRKLGLSFVAETRQVWELPVLKREVVEHRSMQAICRCGQMHNGPFPAGVNASVQYGPRAQAAMVHLNQNHAVSLQRTAALMDDLFDLPVSQATVVNANSRGAQILQPVAQDIGQACAASAVAHADETGTRVGKTLHWLHVLATNALTWVGCHPKRGTQAFEDFGLLNQFRGVLVHDGWLAYKGLDCKHALCNAHHLRELTYLWEEQGQAWAGDMIELLRHANHTDNLARQGKTPSHTDPQYQDQVRQLRDLYEAILADGEAQNPIAAGSAKRGRPKQSKATNLLGRLRQYGDDVWRFMTEPDVPFTNNLAEQAVRMPKVKQKVSGCFRNLQGARTYCTIRTYAATMHKQGLNVFEALVAAFNGALFGLALLEFSNGDQYRPE